MSKVSIIIPAYNCSKTIRRAVNSILDKNSADVECIIVVNNSSDDTAIVCDDLASEYKNVILVKSNASNVSEARNDGLKHITGDIVGFCDSDDYFEADSISVLLEELSVSGADIVACGFNRVTDSIVTSTNKLQPGMRRTEDVRYDILNNPALLGCVWNKLYRREVIGDILFDTSLTHCEDTNFNLRILKNSNLKIKYSEQVLYNYVHNPSSLSNDVNKVFDENNKLKYLYAIEKSMDEYEGSRRFLREAGLKLATLCIDNYSSQLSDDRKEKLRDYIRTNIKYLVLYFYKYEARENLRRLRKGIRILMKI